MSLLDDDRESLEPGMIHGSFSLEGGAVTDSVDPYAGYQDYFGFDERDKAYLPDGRQWVEFKKLNEGERAKYLKATRADVTINSRSGDAKVPFDQSNDRRQLLLHSITDWNMVRKDPKVGRWVPVPFTGNSEGGNLGQWLNIADPSVLARIEKAIRMANPWLMSEMSVEQIDKEITDLQELRKAAVEREAAEKNS